MNLWHSPCFDRKRTFTAAATKLRLLFRSKNKQLEEPLLTTAKILSAMPVTQVSVERLFSSMKFILSDQRLSMTQELLESILYLRANAER